MKNVSIPEDRYLQLLTENKRLREALEQLRLAKDPYIRNHVRVALEGEQ